jgi:hypothetical protein
MSVTSRRLAVATLIVFGIGSIGTQLDAGAQAPAVVRGGANASADSMGFQIINAGASLGWTFGRSTAAYRDITASSEGKAVDLGAVEALFSQPQCGGEVPPVLNMATVPPRTIADSAVSGSEVAKSAEVIYPRLAGDNASDRIVGTQTASATKVPASQSSTTTRNQDFGFFRIEGATSSARTSFENGIRLSEATMSAKRIVVFGGQVVFYEPTWSAKAWSGADTGTEAGFTFRSAQVFGNYLSGAVLERDLKVFETLVEGLLSPFGLDLRYPEVRQPFGATGIEVTPLAFSMSDAPIGKDLLIPLLNTDLLKNYRLASVSEDCRRETFWTIIDALERALGGSGSIEMLVGGAVATTDDTDYSFKPFAEPVQIAEPAPESTPDTEVPADFDAGGGSTEFGGDYSNDGFDAGYSDDFDLGFDDGFYGLESGLDTIVEEVPTEVLASEETAAGTSGSKSEDGSEIAAGSLGDSEDNAAALVVGIMALLGALGLSMGDRIMGMRARRRIE